MAGSIERRFGSRLLTLTNLDRVLWPQTGFTKGDLIDYYVELAPVLLRHLVGRPLTLLRCPAGVEGAAFAQTECRGAPPWMARTTIERKDGDPRRHCLAEEPAALAWLGNQSCVELHAFAGLASDLERPVEIVLDLDPGPGADLRGCCQVALRARALLTDLGRVAMVNSSGSSGLHLRVATQNEIGYGQSKELAREWAETLASESPTTITAELRGDRTRRVFIDWLRNDRTGTTIRPYSPRAVPLPAVAAPLTWEEIERGASGDERAVVHLAGEMPERIDSLGDLFADLSG